MNRLIPACLCLVLVCSATAACAQRKYFTDWPENADPHAVGDRVAAHFVTSSHMTPINYPEVCVWYGALRYAEATGNTDLEKQLQDYKAAYLDIPPLLTDTRNHLRGSQLKLGRTLSPAEAISNPALEIDAVHRILFQKWVADVFRRFDAIKSYLVPDEYAEMIQPQLDARAGKTHRAGAGINLENIL